ncbi:MAG: hypothetical protein V4801_39960 [Burkholderia gladioli]
MVAQFNLKIAVGKLFKHGVSGWILLHLPNLAWIRLIEIGKMNNSDRFVHVKIMIVIVLFPFGFLAVQYIINLAFFNDVEHMKGQYPLIVRHDGRIALVGYEIGSSVGIPECPFAKNGPAVSYTFEDTTTCFKHSADENIGALGNGPEWVKVDFAFEAKHYNAISSMAPVCLGLVDGKIQAISVAQGSRSLGFASLFKAANRQFGKPASRVDDAREVGLYKYVNLLIKWNVAGGGAWLVDKSRFYVVSGRENGRISTLTIFSPLGKDLVDRKAGLLRMACEA